MNNHPKVSVVVPLYEAERYIERTIDSILSQNFTDFEVIMIDDCPRDQTIDIVQSYRDSRIKMIHNDRNRGIAYSRNRAFQFCKGEYITLLDHDDIATPYRFEKHVDFLDRNMEIDIVGGRTQWIDINDQPLHTPNPVLQDPNDLRAKILFYNVYWNCEVMFRRNVIDGGIRYRDNLLGMEDFCFWIDASLRYSMSNIQELVLQHREVPTSETNKVLHEKEEEKNIVFEKLRAHSLTQSGYSLSNKQMDVINKILKENRQGRCEKEEEDLFEEALCSLIRQAEEMQVAYIDALYELCYSFFQEKTEHEMRAIR